MRRIFVLLFIIAGCLALAPAAFAAPKGCDPGDGPFWFDFGLKGDVTAVDVAHGVLTVAVDEGTDGLPDSVAVQIGEDTHLFRTQHHDRTDIALADIAVGDRVMVLGWTDDSTGETVYTAAAVAVSPPCFGLVGTVTAVDVDHGLLTVSVEEASGDLTGEVQIVVTDETHIVRAEFYHFGGHGCDGGEVPLTLADVKVGDSVGVWGTVDNSGAAPVYTADRVCLKAPRFGLVGAVTAVGDDGTLTVSIDHASRGLTGSLDVVVSSETELYKIVDGERTDITLADIAAGDEVSVFGTVDLSTGEAVYTAHVVIDGVSADWLPRPLCKPGDADVAAGGAHKGDRISVRLTVADSMPGCPSASVTLMIKSPSGRTVTTRTVAGVKVNAPVTLAVKLRASLHRGKYWVLATSRDWAGNRQAKARAAVLTVK
jgi:hypothetical protein